MRTGAITIAIVSLMLVGLYGCQSQIYCLFSSYEYGRCQ